MHGIQLGFWERPSVEDARELSSTKTTWIHQRTKSWRSCTLLLVMYWSGLLQLDCSLEQIVKDKRLSCSTQKVPALSRLDEPDCLLVMEVALWKFGSSAVLAVKHGSASGRLLHKRLSCSTQKVPALSRLDEPDCLLVMEVALWKFGSSAVLAVKHGSASGRLLPWWQNFWRRLYLRTKHRQLFLCSDFLSHACQFPLLVSGLKQFHEILNRITRLGLQLDAPLWASLQAKMRNFARGASLQAVSVPIRVRKTARLEHLDHSSVIQNSHLECSRGAIFEEQK